MTMKQYLGNLRSAEEQLAEAYKNVSERHSREFEVHEMTSRFAEWSAGHIEGLKPFIEKYGADNSPEPERLRASLFHGARVGGSGLLRDLQDLSLLANAVRTNLTILSQAAGAAKDKELEQMTVDFGDQVDRELAWMCTHIKNAAPQVLLVPPDVVSQTEASIPKQPTQAAIPEQLWAPIAAGLLTLLVGLAALLVGRAWLFPSLGPTAYLQSENPSHPSVRFYNTFVGHLIGLGVGFLAVFLFNAYNDPVVLQAHKLTVGRLGAAVIALALTIFVALLAKASHPPAGATTLLVALGSIKTVDDALNLAIGALLIALLGEAVRKVRTGAVSRATIEPKIPANAGR